MILRRCLRLTMLACSLCLVNSEEPKLRGAIVPERTLEEEELARHSVPPTKKKTTKTTAKKRTSSGPEETLAKSATNSTEGAKATAPTTAKTKSTTTKKKTAAPTTATELEKTMSPVNDEDKKSEEANGPEEEADDESQLHDESQADGEQPSESQGPDESQKDEQQPTESQRPDESPQGNTQHDVSQEDEKQSDESQHKSKEDESDGSGTPSDATTDPCVNAKTCLECEKAASNSTLDEQTCVWKDSLCKLISKGEAPSETKCDEHEIAAHNTTATQDSVPEEEQEEGSAMPLLVTVMFVLGVLVALRTYLKNHDVILFSGGGIPGIYRRQGLSPRSSRHTETVPLAGVDDDEWGWDDSGGDVELPSSRKQQEDDEDLRLAMALSLSESPTPPQASKSGIGMAPFPTRRTNSGVRTTSFSDDENSPVVHKQVSAPRAPAPLPPAVPKIAGLGVRQTVPTRKKEEKPKEDDIFASIGLTAKPKFSSRPTAPGGYTSGARTAPAPVTSALSAAVADVGDVVGEDWGDDSDLDDLLDE